MLQVSVDKQQKEIFAHSLTDVCNREVNGEMMCKRCYEQSGLGFSLLPKDEPEKGVPCRSYAVQRSLWELRKLIKKAQALEPYIHM